MNFLSSFGLGGNKAPQQEQQNSQQGGQPPSNQQNTSPNQQDGGNPNNQNNGSNTQVDPLATYSKMFDNNPDKQKEGPPSLNLDPEVLNKISSGLNFMEGVPQELMQKATNGDMQALMQMMNHVGQRAYQTSLHHSGAVVDKFVGAREAHFAKSIPTQVRDELTMNSLAGPTRVSSPTAKKQLAEIARRMASTNPDASPQEIATSAKQYIEDLYKSINPETQSSNQNSQNAGEFDWDKWANNQ